MRAGGLTRGGTTSVRVQTRGGGRGGLSDRETTLEIRGSDLSEDAMAGARTDGFTSAPTTLKHLSTHPADDPQSPGPRLSQGVPCGQQSTCMDVTNACGEAVPAMPTETGNMATESATTETKMARMVLMSPSAYPPTLTTGQVTGRTSACGTKRTSSMSTVMKQTFSSDGQSGGWLVTKWL